MNLRPLFVTSSLLLFTICLLISLYPSAYASEHSFDPNEKDYYRMLGIDRNADNREIRKAFKKLALVLHPDKNVDDPKAHDNFLKLNRAYEVLKDEELRNIFNTQGESGLRDKENGFNGGRSYHGWSYYHDTFGIYDNDEEIVTLVRSDFEQTIRNAGVQSKEFIWFVNFYSPQCSHCHHLAPEWRKVARELGRIIRIGAVNCGEDRSLCREEGISSYPSLVLYPSKVKFQGERTADNLINFVVKHLNLKQYRYNDVNMDRLLSKVAHKSKESHFFTKYLIIACYNHRNCLPEDTAVMLTYKLQNLLHVVQLDCSDSASKVCEHFGLHESKVALFPDIPENARNYYEISVGDTTAEPIDLFRKVMNKFPKIQTVSSKQLKLVKNCLFSEIKDKSKCAEELSPGWIIAATTDQSEKSDDLNDFDIELKSLAQFLPKNAILKLTCTSGDLAKELCAKLNLKKYPSVLTVKSVTDSKLMITTTSELYYGRLNAIDILNFADESFQSKLKALSPEEFESNVHQNPDEPSLVQFFAPWCPACKTAKQTLRKVSQHEFAQKINFGVIDCAVHGQLCRQYNINSYPTVIFYNQTFPHQYFGKYQQEEDVVDFVENILQSSLTELDPTSFAKLVEKRTGQTVWSVDFYSPYCQPCNELGPVWRKLANMLQREEPNAIKLGAINCVKWNSFCRQHQVQSYPTLRTYPALEGDDKHQQSFYRFNEQRRDLYLIRAWLYDFLPVSSAIGEIRSGSDFENEIFNSKKPLLIDFYAPWAFSSKKFGPDFIQLSKNLTEVKFLRVNCQRFSSICDRAEVEYFPSVRLYGGHKSPRQSWHGIHIQFPGAGTEAMSNIIRDLLPSITFGGPGKDEL